MLKKVNFEISGEIFVDLSEESSYLIRSYVEDFVRDNFSEYCDINTTTIKSEKDIREEWKNDYPFGDRTDKKTCIEIFNEEILPKLPINDPNQLKMNF